MDKWPDGNDLGSPPRVPLQGSPVTDIMKSSHTMCIAFRNAIILKDELFEDEECILTHRQAVAYPILITPSGECLHYYI